AFIPPAGAGVGGGGFFWGGGEICSLPGGGLGARRGAPPHPIEGFALSPGGRLLATGGGDPPAPNLASAELYKVATTAGHHGNTYAAAFTPDGSRLVTSGSQDNSIRIWDLPPACRAAK